MHLVELRPAQLEKAVKNNIPVVMVAGCVEYHGPHLPIGTDLLIGEAILTRVEKQIPEGCIVATPLPYAPTMNWAGSAAEGDMDFSPDTLHLYAREVFYRLTQMGFRRIYVLQHHQGAEGLPALSLKKAAADVVRNVTKAWGAGWGRQNTATLPVPGIFDLIKIAHADSFSDYTGLNGPMPVGHGGKGETQLMLAGFPELVEINALDITTAPEWLKDAPEAAVLEGVQWLHFCVEGWVRELTGEKT